MTPEGEAAMATIIDWLMKRPDSADFREPLDWRGLGLNDYLKVIEKKPMDLATVKQNLNLKRYRTIHHCADDIRLIWSNCKKYNGEGSAYYILADSLSKRFEEYFDVARFGPCIKTEKRGRDADTEEASKKMRKSINDVAADLVCPITQELPIDPVIAEDGKIYERNAILEWFSEKGARITSPSTNARMGTRLLPAVQTRNTIRTLIESGAIEGELAKAWQTKLAEEAKVKAERAKAEAGNGYSMFLLGVWSQHGAYGLAKSDGQARAWYERSAAVRHPHGMAAFGECLLLGYGGPENTSLGLVYTTDAAHLGSDLGAYLLGAAFFHGMYNLPKDTVQARFWLKKVDECNFKNLTEEALAKAARWLRRIEDE
jgi:hypothetical protein